MTGTWRRGWVIAALAVALAALMALHAYIPNGVRNLGSLLETFLPWLGLPIPILAGLAIYRRSAPAGIAVLLPIVVWLALFGEIVLPAKGGGPHDLRVVSNNVLAGNEDPAATSRQLVAADPDVIGLQEIPSNAVAAYEAELASAYRYHVVRGTVGLWSRFPITEPSAVDLRLGWDRALRAVVHAPAGTIAVYVAHMPSVRVDVDQGFTADQRDDSAAALGEALSAERNPRVVLLADLNGSVYDRALAPITAQLDSAQAAAGSGFGFSWPAGFPLARIDHVLIRGVDVAHAWVLPADGSDHRPVAADLRLAKSTG
ncbi:endonuclease/exonuclease/phosphatase family protein [Hamadaea sp. NPDC051192]|uniref:endonuclease/exonuclease/phosphatase family protein n=1 Tax=Hamadaea sp. NPDC051192 TaxID=3154940 RepID=UPI00343EDD67